MYARYVELAPMKNQEAQTIKASLMQHWVYRHGKPRTALSDQAKNIDGEVMRNLCNALEIEKKHSSPYHPEGDGMAERAIQTIKSMLRCVLEEEDVSVYKWPDALQQVAFLFNASSCISTGMSPYEVMYGDKPDLPITIMTSSYENDARINRREYCEELKCKLESTWNEVGQKMKVEKEKRAMYYNQGKQNKPAEKGDLVYIKDNARSHCLAPKFVGPFEVLWRRGPNIKVKLHENKEKVVHLNNCKIVKDSNYEIYADTAEPTTVMPSNDQFLTEDDAGVPDGNAFDAGDEAEELELSIAVHTTAAYTARPVWRELKYK